MSLVMFDFVDRDLRQIRRQSADELLRTLIGAARIRLAKLFAPEIKLIRTQSHSVWPRQGPNMSPT